MINVKRTWKVVVKDDTGIHPVDSFLL